MPAINVFIAYVDSFIGQHLAKQFANKPSLFNVFGCTWEEVVAESLGIQTLEQQQQHRETAQGPHFFWHRNMVLMRKALLQCDWIIIEQRQSQDVFDMLSYLQESSFEKPKKLVLLSNFMTWFSTPPLSYPEVDEDENKDDVDDMEEGLEDDITAPYPPPPEEKEKPSEDADEDDNEEPPEGKEILTEDQYNRRIPHIKYFNWRDAEKAVAAAHHAKGLPLDTFVIFAGLPYGNGENVLQPFLRQAWSKEPGTLPIYGTGDQCVPMIHVRDLATFTRKLLRCPTEDLPNPHARYMFATDGASITWRDIIETINKMFGNRMTLKEVPPAEFPLHNNVEFFTIDLRLDNSTIQAIMEREDATKEEGITEGPVLHHDSNGSGQTWIAQGGIKKNSLKIALEFQHFNQVTPLRVALLGPPKVGKTYLSEKLSTRYKLPRFSMDEVVEAFKAELQGLQNQLAQYQEGLIAMEKQRRLQIKKRRIFFAARKAEDEDEAEVEDGNEDGDQPKPVGQPPVREESEDDVEEKEERELQLTEEEEKEAEELMEERFQSSERTNRLRNDISRMERILLMRVRPRPPTPDANPKKRANLTKKKLTKEQQRKKEEDELQQAKEALKDAPFQDRALALMMRWRLAKPDCRAQGYVLDGFPPTVELARLCFSSEELPAPESEEEALNPPAPPVKELNEDGEEENPRTSEPADEWLLPDYVVFLRADENYLLDRFTTVCQRRAEAAERQSPLSPGEMGTDGALGAESSNLHISDNAEEARALERFHEQLEVYRHQVCESSYSLYNFFECTVTIPGEVTVGGRRPVTCEVSVQESEALVPPPPPASEFELVPPSEGELAICNILGAPHNFGKTPLEIHEEEVRRQNLEEEKRQKQIKKEHEVREREEQAFLVESELRNKHDLEQLEIKRADYEQLEKRKDPLRRYLIKNVIPLVSKGLTEVCASRPDEPVDFLAEWLLRHNPHDDVFTDI
eukprot:gene4240-3064_t